jgi:peptidoglycan/LPS O-acetylase OafA/YrhL
MIFLGILISVTADLCLESLTDGRTASKFVESMKYSGKGLNEQGKQQACKDSGSDYYILFLKDKSYQDLTHIGVCLPKTCDIFHLSKILSTYSIFVETPENSEISTWGTVFAVVLLLYIALCIFCGIIQYSRPDLKKIKIIQSFSSLAAIKGLLKTRPNNDLGLFNGLRLISFIMVIYGHTILIKLKTSLINIEEIGETFKHWWGVWAYAGFFSVDVFFFISGFIIAYFLLMHLVKNQKISLVLLYIHRITRILPALLVALGVNYFLVPSLFSGPIWKYYRQSLTSGCSNYWWAQVLFINNFYPNHPKDECFGTTWYIANDMQFFLVSPLIINVYFRSARKYWIWYFSGLTFLAIFVSSSLIGYNYRVSVNPLAAEYEDGVDVNFRYFYVRPYVRFPPYLQGLLLGVLYYHLKNPDEFQEDWISKSVVNQFKKSLVIQIGAFFLGVFLMVHSVLVQKPVYEDLFDTSKLSRWENAIFMSYFRFGFTLGLALVVFLMLIGKCKAINFLLSARWMEVLGKLTYSGYLYHIIVLAALSYTSHHTFMSGTFLLKEIVVFTLLSLLCGFCSYIWVEVPLQNLEEMLLKH